MADLSNYNTEGVEPQKSFEPLPPGWYQVVVTETEMRETKAGTGRYLNIRLDVVQEEYKGRVLFDKMNLDNPNEKAVEIAMRQLAGLKLACGLPHITRSEELHNIPILARVKISKPREGYEPSNEVTEYRADGAPPATTAAPTAAPARQSQPATSGAAVPPWKKGGAK